MKIVVPTDLIKPPFGRENGQESSSDSASDEQNKHSRDIPVV